jgi:hypothetical protein
MPQSAVSQVPTDHIVPIREMAPRLASLVQKPAVATKAPMAKELETIRQVAHQHQTLSRDNIAEVEPQSR